MSTTVYLDRKIRVVFFTAAYPYYPGEQFIEAEIDHWSGLEWADVLVCPSVSHGVARPVPGDIAVCAVKSASPLERVVLVARALTTLVFWKEIRHLWQARQLGVATLVAALRTMASVLAAKRKMLQVIRQHGHIDIAYCYWNMQQAYASCLLKRDGLMGAVVSRAHGYDLYEERAARGYMPLKRQFAHDFDRVFPISQQGSEYLQAVYGFGGQSLEVARLGVALPKALAAVSTDGVIRVVSVSFCAKVKRINLIIEAIRVAATSEPARRFMWTHIGDGEMLAELEVLAAARLGSLVNISFRFAGGMPNQGVLGFYVQNPVDVFVNASESEGVPVSIMEAMARGVPAIAPAVGGIPELVDDECGALLQALVTPESIAEALLRISGAGHAKFRAAARRRIEQLYDATANYGSFVEAVRQIAQSRSDVVATDHAMAEGIA